MGIKKNTSFLASSYSMQPKMVAYCSSEAKIFNYAFTNVKQFLYFDEAKIAIWLFNFIITSALIYYFI